MTEMPGKARIDALIADLRKAPAFADLSNADLEWFITHAEERLVQAGEVVTQEGSPADTMLVLLEGEIRGRRESEADGPTYAAQAPAVTGFLPFSRMKIVPLTTRAVRPVRALAMNSKHFPEMLHRMPDLAQRLVGVLTDRVRTFAVINQEREKLAALGKLSAGLAHELNNPAAAARRSAGSLRDCLERLRQVGRSSTIGPEDCAMLAKREEEIRAALKPAQFKDEFARVEREEAIQSWLEGHNVADAWKLAPLLMEAIKEYSYMDQAKLQEVDITKSLETTLTIMHHKLKRGISVMRNYAPDLPKIMAYGSELNQVWTNLIDNAADAMGDNGKLRIRTARENDFILVEIADNGPGIPPDVKPRIFDPFFTTKGVGEGPGLGLDFVYRIVTEMHGQISVDSVPGDTRFAVRIPIQAAQ